MTIKELENELSYHEQKVEDFKNAILSLQKVCDHEFESKGHTHNKEILECKKCKTTNWQ